MAVATKEPTPCHLLNLPAELRNRIYREVPLSSSLVFVSVRGYERSALLATCKIIRNEATSIYHHENEFRLDSFEFSPDVPHRFFKSLSKMKLKLGKMATSRPVFSGTWKWENVLDTMRLIHSKAMPGFGDVRMKDSVGDIDSTTMLLIGMFLRVDKLAGQSWELVKGLLEDQKAVMMVVDEGSRHE